ncbi:protein Tob1 [Ranitomeya variabilis]|uniref:protein Tob1 n=1 Tax=Ranitomeya variabilis TaxID=490064 RepID=UPI004055B6EC
MQLEIQVALNFIISYLYNKLPRRRVNIFGEELERLLKKKYEGHWYPDKPYKGSGYRCIHVGEKVEPVIEQAANESGLDVEDIRRNLPQDLNVWIDPSEVSYQIGEKGQVKVLYVDDDNNENGAELDKEIKNSFNPEAQVFMPIIDQASPVSSSPSPPFNDSAAVSPTFMPRAAQPLTFTTATFAATKFGSTKMKTNARNKLARSSPTQFGFNNLVKQSAMSSSMHSVYSLGLTNLPQKTSALSPNAKEFIFPGEQGRSGLNCESGLSLGALPYSNAFDMFSAYGGLHDKSLVEGLSFVQYNNQQFQPVMAN